MSVYKRYPGLNGSWLYRRDGRICKTIEVPVNVVELLKTQEEVDDEGLPESPGLRPCIFCGEHSKLQRMLNSQTVYLCNEHYYSKTIGQVAEKIRGA